MANVKKYTKPGIIAKATKSNVVKDATGLSAPWVSYFKEVYNVFRHDENVTVDEVLTEEGDGVYSFKIESASLDKVAALKKILKTNIQFGNITLRIDINHIVDEEEEATGDDWLAAFEGNPYFETIVTEPVPGSSKAFAVFERKILTYYNDDISDYCCNRHVIVADAVREIVKEGSVSPCTKAAAE